MGAMHMAPMDSLDVHADLLPFQLLTEKLVHRATASLETFPASSPSIQSHEGAAIRYVKRHEHGYTRSYMPSKCNWMNMSDKPNQERAQVDTQNMSQYTSIKEQAMREAEEVEEEVRFFWKGSALV